MPINDPIYDAIAYIRSGDLEGVRKWIKEKPELAKAKDSDGMTLLHWAVVHGKNENLGLVEFLLSLDNVDVRAKNKLGATPLHEATSKGAIAALLAKGAKADINLKDDRGRNPLVGALRNCNGDMDAINLLIKNGADLSSVDDEVLNEALFDVLNYGFGRVAEYIITARPGLINGTLNGESVLYRALSRTHKLMELDDPEGYIKFFTALVEAKPDALNEKYAGGKNALDVIIESLVYGAMPIGPAPVGAIKILLEKKPDLILSISKENSQSVAFRFILSQCSSHVPLGEKIIEFLVQNNLDLDKLYKNDMTPLMWAVKNGNAKLIQKLIEEGVDLNIKNKQGKTALEYTQDPAIIKVLKETKYSNKAEVVKMAKEVAKVEDDWHKMVEADRVARMKGAGDELRKNLEKAEARYEADKTPANKAAMDAARVQYDNRAALENESAWKGASRIEKLFDTEVRDKFSKEFWSYSKNPRDRSPENEKACVAAILKEVKALVLDSVIEDQKIVVASNQKWLERNQEALSNPKHPDHEKLNKEAKIREEETKFSDATQRWVEANKAILVDPEHPNHKAVMAESRKYLHSFKNIAMTAWRSFDPGAPHQVWPSLFVLGDLPHDREQDLQGNEMVAGKVARTQRMLAYAYLAAKDPTNPADPKKNAEAVQARKSNIVAKLADNRRAHNEAKYKVDDIDDCSCYPGSVGRIGDMLKGNDKVVIPMEPAGISSAYVSAWVTKALEQEFFGKTYEEKIKLYKALTLMNNQNNKDIADNSLKYTRELYDLRAGFLKTHFGSAGELIDRIIAELRNANDVSNLTNLDMQAIRAMYHNIGTRKLEDIDRALLKTLTAEEQDRFNKEHKSEKEQEKVVKGVVFGPKGQLATYEELYAANITIMQAGALKNSPVIMKSRAHKKAIEDLARMEYDAEYAAIRGADSFNENIYLEDRAKFIEAMGDRIAALKDDKAKKSAAAKPTVSSVPEKSKLETPMPTSQPQKTEQPKQAIALIPTPAQPLSVGPQKGATLQFSASKKTDVDKETKIKASEAQAKKPAVTVGQVFKFLMQKGMIDELGKQHNVSHYDALVLLNTIGNLCGEEPNAPCPLDVLPKSILPALEKFSGAKGSVAASVSEKAKNSEKTKANESSPTVNQVFKFLMQKDMVDRLEGKHGMVLSQIGTLFDAIGNLNNETPNAPCSSAVLDQLPKDMLPDLEKFLEGEQSRKLKHN